MKTDNDNIGNNQFWSRGAFKLLCEVLIEFPSSDIERKQWRKKIIFGLLWPFWRGCEPAVKSMHEFIC